MISKQYRKKAVVIDAFLWEGGGDSSKWPTWLVEKNPEFVPDDFKLVLPTLEGNLTASRGDFIIRGVQGEVYACKPDIFWMTYEET